LVIPSIELSNSLSLVIYPLTSRSVVVLSVLLPRCLAMSQISEASIRRNAPVAAIATGTPTIASNATYPAPSRTASPLSATIVATRQPSMAIIDRLAAKPIRLAFHSAI
jgi:hypothetical protein